MNVESHPVAPPPPQTPRRRPPTTLQVVSLLPPTPCLAPPPPIRRVSESPASTGRPFFFAPTAAAAVAYRDPQSSSSSSRQEGPVLHHHAVVTPDQQPESRGRVVTAHPHHPEQQQQLQQAKPPVKQLFYPSSATATAVVSHSPPHSTVPKQEEGYHFILANLQRPDPTAAWGLSLRQLGPGIYVITDVEDASRAIIRGYAEARSTHVHPTCFLYRNREPLHRWTRRVLDDDRAGVIMSSCLHPTPVARVLRPGDVFLSVAGRAAGDCPSLAGWCAWLRRSPPTTATTSLWVLVRCAADTATVWGRPRRSCPRTRKEHWGNPTFRDDATGTLLRFEDDMIQEDPDDGQRAALFLTPITDVASWLESRKRSWRTLYTVHGGVPQQVVDPDVVRDDNDDDDLNRNDNNKEDGIAVDFWTPQGFDGFPDWLSTRTKHWQSRYSWNVRKRQRLVQDCQDTRVSFDDDRTSWLRVRKNQWRVLRRRRQRERGESSSSGGRAMVESFIVDDLIEKQEQERKAWESRPPLDISFVFDAAVGCPDDAVHRILSFLRTSERAVVLRVSHTTRHALQQRERLWRMLCPDTWTLPRRPRKPWHQIYWTRLRVETEQRHKKWDDLLTRASQSLFHGDQLSVIEKMVSEAEQDSGFHVDYVSSVVCERNSLLNLAVIHRRHRVVRWLVETKGADIESFDRGDFTPLLNAAWAGDKFLVRFLMLRGASRAKKGTFHYTKPLAPPEFSGLTAEGWAEKRGHKEIAKLLRLGL